MKRVVIVGASLAGVRAATALRRLGYAGELVLIGDEPHAPYDRPPLSKEVLRGTFGVERLALLKEGKDSAEALTLTLRLGARAEALDLARREIVTQRERIGFDGLVIATGARARTLPGAGSLAGVHVLRTLDDALALREALGRARTLTVVGAGFVGAEVASTAREAGLSVDVLERAPLPMADVVGARMAEVLASLHEAHGVRLHAGVAVEALEGEAGRVTGVRLADGRVLSTEAVLVGIGAVPNTEWLAGAGVALDDGVVCDATCAVLDAGGRRLDGVVAAGDVARYESVLFGERLRIEHWTHAAEQADRAARTLLGERTPFRNAPLFWSDQYGLRIQLAGRAQGADRVEVCEGSVADKRFVALYARGERLVAALAVRRPAQLMRYRRLIESEARFDDALASAPG